MYYCYAHNWSSPNYSCPSCAREQVVYTSAPGATLTGIIGMKEDEYKLLLAKIEKLEAENKKFREALVSAQLLNAEAINEIGSNFIYDGVLNIRRAQEVIKEALKESE